MPEQFFWEALGRTHHRDGLPFSRAVSSSTRVLGLAPLSPLFSKIGSDLEVSVEN